MIIALSFLSKIVTFLANTYIIRQLDPDTKGVCTLLKPVYSNLN